MTKNSVFESLLNISHNIIVLKFEKDNDCAIQAAEIFLRGVLYWNQNMPNVEYKLQETGRKEWSRNANKNNRE